MVMEGKKGGQFYLVAAIVIITILIGFSVVSNYSRNKEVVLLYDLKQELNIETARVLEYGIYQEEAAKTVLSEFAESYADYAGEGKNMYFFFGNFQDVTAVAYQDLSNNEIKIALRKGGGKEGRDDLRCDINGVPTNICESILGEQTEMVQGQNVTFKNFAVLSGTQVEPVEQVHLLINILDAEYHFRLRTGENFYFVLEQTVGEERYVVSG